MEKFHNPYHRQLSELKACLLDAISPENALSLCRALQRDCLTTRGRDRDEAWDRFFRLLEILGLPTIVPDMVKANELSVFRASPPPMVEKIMRKEPAAAAVETTTTNQPCPRT